ncbi:MAG: hypothetical protein Q9P44_09375 [Anaerolineae bacterium]|nr:hypothetical protein [Anaerolineae bacterium]
MTQYPQEKPKNKVKNSLSNGNQTLSTAALMEIFDFSDSMLNMNRKGSASGLQKEYLKSDLKENADAMWLLMMIMLGTSLVVGVIMATQGIPMQYLAIGAGIVILPILLMGYRQQIGARKDLDIFNVQTAEGQAQIEWASRGTHIVPLLRVDQTTFEIGHYEAKTLEQFDLPYLRVYYAENSKQLLSAEVMTTATKNRLSVDDLLEDNADVIIETGRKYDERQA